MTWRIAVKRADDVGKLFPQPDMNGIAWLRECKAASRLLETVETIGEARQEAAHPHQHETTQQTAATWMPELAATCLCVRHCGSF